jgi:hypothetical protein
MSVVNCDDTDCDAVLCDTVPESKRRRYRSGVVPNSEFTPARIKDADQVVKCCRGKKFHERGEVLSCPSANKFYFPNHKIIAQTLWEHGVPDHDIPALVSRFLRDIKVDFGSNQSRLIASVNLWFMGLASSGTSQ